MQLAQINKTFGTINPPPQFGATPPRGAVGINMVLENLVTVFFSAAALAFIIMFVWGAVQMVLSGGDKEAVAKAKSKITWAIVGVALLAFSYLIFALLQYLTGFKFFV